MGKGLSMTSETKGSHIAFSAGTGILVFIDLVAKIALSELGLIPEQDRLHPEFKFILYASFLNKDDAIALELLEKLAEFVKSRGSNSFKLNLLMIDKTRKRWDEQFILQCLKETACEKVWVCGPPIMQEQFDVFLEDVVPKVGMDYKT